MTQMTEIQGKSILVRVSARFELARVRVIGSRLYFLAPATQDTHCRFAEARDRKIVKRNLILLICT